MYNSIISIITIFIFPFSIQVASYKCQQPSGEYLYSNKPCPVSIVPKELIMTTPSGKIAKLSISEHPIPLPLEIVNGLFSHIETACQTKDGNTLLAQFSSKIQKEYLANKSKQQSLFKTLSNNCRIFKDIRDDIKKSSDPVLYATKMPNQDIVLCFYTAKKGLENCKGSVKVTIEDNQFKLNSAY